MAKVEMHKLQRRMDAAMKLLHHDRWAAGPVHWRRLDPLIANPGPVEVMQPWDLPSFAILALQQRKPFGVFTFTAPAAPPGEDWLRTSPEVIYAPVPRRDGRSCGLLVIASSNVHAYSDDDVRYAETLALAVGPAVEAAWPWLWHLRPIDRQVLQLLGQGLSDAEVAAALRLDLGTAARLAGELRKLFAGARRRQAGYALAPGRSDPKRKIAVPLPGALTTSNLPPTPAARSRIPISP